MAISSAQLTAAMFPDQPLLGVEFGVVARMCLADWAQSRSLARPTAPARTISIRQMAFSLGEAPETTRRHVNRLIERGAFVSSAQGVSLATTAENEALVVGYYLGVHDLFLRLIEDMTSTCDLDLYVGEAPAFGIADVIERALDALLQPIDTFRPAGSGRLAFLIWGALTVVAVRKVTHDPVLGRRYANAMPPDELRAAISVRRLAAALSIPYATAWRQVQGLEAKGLVTRLSDDRWTVLTANLQRDSVYAIGRAPSNHLLRMIREIAQLGLDPAAAADHYRLGRPPLADFGLSQNR